MNRLILTTAVAVSLAAPAAAQAALTVYAASSLRDAFPEIDGAPRYNFAGSNQLQPQIERGAPADVFASASPTEAQALFKAGRCERPVTFATNIVVMLVPAGNPAELDVGLRRSSAARSAGSRSATPACRSAPTRASCCAACGCRRSSRGNIVSAASRTSRRSVEGRARLRRRGLRLRHRRARRAATGVKVIRLPKWAQPPVRYQICVGQAHAARTPAGRERVHRQGAFAARPPAARSVGLRPAAARLVSSRLHRTAGALPRRRPDLPGDPDHRAVHRGAAGRRPGPAARPGRAGHAEGHRAHERVANVLILGFGTPAAYLLATRRFRAARS